MEDVNIDEIIYKSKTKNWKKLINFLIYRFIFPFPIPAVSDILIVSQNN